MLLGLLRRPIVRTRRCRSSPSLGSAVLVVASLEVLAGAARIHLWFPVLVLKSLVNNEVDSNLLPQLTGVCRIIPNLLPVELTGVKSHSERRVDLIDAFDDAVGEAGLRRLGVQSVAHIDRLDMQSCTVVLVRHE